MGYENFNLFSGLSWFATASGAEWFMNLAKLRYNIFYLMSILFMGFKLIQAACIWLARSDAVFGHAKQQMLVEILEPAKGPIQRFDEFEDKESPGYIVKLKRQPSITFRIYKNSWKMPTVEYGK